MQTSTSVRICKLAVCGCLFISGACPNLAQADNPAEVEKPASATLGEKQNTKTITSDKDLPPLVSMIALIANQKMFDQREVRVVGYLIVDFEHNALYFSESDAKNGMSSNSIWIDGEEVCAGSEKNQSYVMVRGVFIAKPGPRGLFSGRMERLSRCDLWDRNEGQKGPSTH